MGWRPRLVLNENKRSTWARSRVHVSPAGLPSAVGVLSGARHHSPPEPLPTVTEDSRVRSDPFPQPLLPGAQIAPLLHKFPRT